MLSSHSWGHTCKSHLIPFTEKAERTVCLCSNSDYTCKINPRHYICTVKTVLNILSSWLETQSALAIFTSLLKMGVVAHACNPSCIGGRQVSMRYEAATCWASQVSYHVWHQYDDDDSDTALVIVFPTERESTWLRNKATCLLPAHSSLSNNAYQNCWWFKSIGQMIEEWTYSPSYPFCCTDHTVVRHRLQRWYVKPNRYCESGLSELNSKFSFLPENKINTA